MNQLQPATNPYCKISLETRYLRQTADSTKYTLAHFFDDTLNLFYFTSKDQCDVVLYNIELYGTLALIENSNYA
jgi:hypothetical protein